MSAVVRNPKLFWSAFAAGRASIEARLAAAAPARGPAPLALMRTYFADVLDAAAAYDPGLSIEIERGDEGAWRLIVTADGAVESFASARDLVAAAPALPGWRLEALRPRRTPPDRLVAGEARLDVRGLRCAYGLANDRMVVMALAEGDLPADYFEAQYLARRLVADLLGEADFALGVADARLMRYEDWLAATPGGRSWPIAELPARFDAIFHPAVHPARARPGAQAPVQRLALCA